MTDRQLSQNAVIAAIEGEVSYNPAHGDTNRALERIIAAVTALPDAWRPIEEAPVGEHIMAAVKVQNNKTGEEWWDMHTVAIDDETGEIMHAPTQPTGGE